MRNEGQQCRGLVPVYTHLETKLHLFGEALRNAIWVFVGYITRRLTVSQGLCNRNKGNTHGDLDISVITLVYSS